ATDTFAVGLGIDWQRTDAEFTSRANYSAGLVQAVSIAAMGGQIPPELVGQIAALTPGLESKVRIKGDDSAWGWNVGFLWDVTPQTRIGAQYRSSIKYDIAANVSFDNPTPTVPPALQPRVALLST